MTGYKTTGYSYTKAKCFKLQGKLTIYTNSKTHKLQRQ